MKKIITVILALALMLPLAGCGNKEATSPEEGSGSVESENVVEEAESSDSGDSGDLSPEFKKTMDDYEAWFDHYCDVMKRYKELPVT